MAKIKVKRVLIDPKFIGDVCCRCDKWFAEILSHGGTVPFDLIYECSASLRDYPIQYRDTGDMGGCARISFDLDEAEIHKHVCRNYLLLLGASDVLWELGLTLHFGKDGKHAVNHHSVDVLVDEDDI